MDAVIVDQIIKSGHFVYKEGTHGSHYLDKETLVDLGAEKLVNFVRLAGLLAWKRGFYFDRGFKEIGIITPAMGAIVYGLILAEQFEKLTLGRVKFFPARTELRHDETDKKIHYIPEKFIPLYYQKPFIIFEDIVNNGTTVREVSQLIVDPDVLNGEILGVISLIDRGGQSAKSLLVEQYAPLVRIKMQQFSANVCPQCYQGVPINTDLGKGERWVKLFGQPPYPQGKDFSAF